MRLLIGAALVFALFQWVATALESDRGQAGVLVGAIVVSATIAAECLLFGTGLARAVRRLGFGAPRWRGVLAAGGAGALLLLVFPGSQALTETSFEMYPGWGRLMPGLFAQGAVKVIVPVEESPRFPLVWIAASATLPFAVLLMPRRNEERKTS